MEACDAVQKSYGRCLIDRTFFSRFYQRLIDSSEDIAATFAKTDLEKQKAAVENGLTMVLMYAKGVRWAEAPLTRIRTSHAADRLAIRPEWYKNWVDALIETVRETDDQCTEELEQQWRQVLARPLEFIKSGF
jgi:hemoglobin-like flavoprotein